MTNAGTTSAASVQTEMLRTAYAAHFDLCKHYSNLVFRGRIAIVTLTIGAVSFALGLVPTTAVTLTKPDSLMTGALAYIAAWLVALLHSMEVSYVKRFYQVVSSGRALEEKEGIASYFSSYDKPESWPLRVIYIFSVAVLVLVALARCWGLSHDWPLRPMVLMVGVLSPAIPLWLSVNRAQECYKLYFPMR
jgi:amino acid transporter